MKKIIILIFICFTAFSCEEALREDPSSLISSNNFFSNSKDAVAAINGAYAVMSSAQYYGRMNFLLWELPAHTQSVSSNASRIQLDKYTYDATNNNINTLWRSLYFGINRANSVLDNVSTIDMNEDLKNRILGEAYFLRGLHYFNLVRTWGNVPLILSEVTSLDNINVDKTSKDEVYDQIINDLKEAELKLPLNSAYSSEDKGRASKGSAQSLLAKVYLNLQRWDEAKEYTLKVIDSNEYELFDNYLDNWREATENGKEHIFSVQFSSVSGGKEQNITDSFSPRFSGLGDRSGGWGSYVAEIDFYENYPDGDPRKKHTYLVDTIAPNSGELLRFPDQGLQFPHVKKWMIKDKGMNGRGINFTVLRYADVLLMLAEAENELNGPTELAVDAINQIRARARGNGSYPEDIFNSVSKDQLRDAIYRERELELAFECHSWFDLKRTGRLLKVMGEQEGLPVQEKHKNFPIPQRELDNNPNLTQTNGWSGL